MESVALSVKGMTCGGCVKSVTRVLSALAGVENVQVTLEGASAKFDFDPAKIELAVVKAAIAEAGFEVA